MHYSDLPALIADRKKTLAKGPIALVLVEDEVEVASTFDHLATQGFAQTIAFCAQDIWLPEGVVRVDYDVLHRKSLPEIVNVIIAATPGLWLYVCHNAEYLYYPFCESRTVGELARFAEEERRETVMTTVVDLYGDGGIDRDDAFLDGAGYYALERVGPDNASLEKNMDIRGGLRWRFEEHLPKSRLHLDRACLFKSVPDLQMLPDGSFNMHDHNTVSCPWHHNPTAAVCSFRLAKALRRNPGSRDKIAQFTWQNAVRFEWSSQQLLDLGMMEPGQWF